MSEENGKRSLSTQLEERNISAHEWHTLTNSLYPGARPASVLMVIDYCRARSLDPLKKPCHIVPMKVKNVVTDKEEWRDVILPGIYELRMTAQRTREYLGHTKPEYGPFLEFGGVSAPEWCEMTMKRAARNNHVCEFPVRVYFREVCATKSDGKANARWSRAPIQMLTKCTEGAGLREAFPDEIGGEMSVEEMHGQVIDGEYSVERNGHHEQKPQQGKGVEGLKKRLIEKKAKPEEHDDFRAELEEADREEERQEEEA